MKQIKSLKQRNMGLHWNKELLHYKDNCHECWRKWKNLRSHHKKIDDELSVNRTVAITLEEGEEKIVVMNRGHSMFMNCVPIMKINLGPNVLAKICSVVWNTLFKSAKFYPQPSHANKVVGICMYDCGFCFPGVKGDWIHTRHWDVIRNEVIFQTGILWQQVILHWHIVSRGK